MWIRLDAQVYCPSGTRFRKQQAGAFAALVENNYL
jgi:hypothetical protein